MPNPSDHTTPTGRRPAAVALVRIGAAPYRGIVRSLAPKPVCDGCHDPAADGPWHGGEDGSQFCDGCHALIVA
ncbi:MAG: hypothetical protein H0V44_04695 [Planctomycetes bacterium]|nr:hypothetical protein [Planctomycetota bacterium]